MSQPVDDIEVLGLEWRQVRLTPSTSRWAELYAVEAVRLRAALGPLATAVEHFGSTSVPGLPAKPILDVLVAAPAAADPAPLAAALAPLGYEYRPDAGIGHLVFGRGQPRTHLLHVVPSGGPEWARGLRFRDALRDDPALAAEYAALKAELAARHPADRPAYTAGKAAFIARVADAPPSHEDHPATFQLCMRDSSFAPVHQAVAPLVELPCSWFIVGGWAIDLHLGHVSRAHGDVDVAVYRRDQTALHAFLTAGGWVVQKVVAGRLEPWQAAEWLALPVHEVHAESRLGDERLEFLLNEGDDQQWRFRKAPAAVARLRALVEHRHSGGLPYYAPEVPLLYKALTSDRRPSDDADFGAALPTLGAEPRAWLAAALRGLAPFHPWLAPLSAASDA